MREALKQMSGYHNEVRNGEPGQDADALARETLEQIGLLVLLDANSADSRNSPQAPGQ